MTPSGTNASSAREWRQTIVCAAAIALAFKIVLALRTDVANDVYRFEQFSIWSSALGVTLPQKQLPHGMPAWNVMIPSVNRVKEHTEILLAAVLVNTWLVYSGPGLGEIPGLFPLLAVLIALTPVLTNLVNRATPGPGAQYAVIFGLTWLGLSPSNMTTLVQPECWRVLCGTAGIVAGLVLYEWRPEWRRFGIFLLPVLAAAFCHRAALAFGPLLFAYIFLFEEDGHGTALPWAIARSLPAWLVSSLALRLASGPAIPLDLKIVQGAQTLSQFIAPWTSGGAPGQDASTIALIFLAGVAVYTAMWRHTRAISFGLAWFLVVSWIAPSQSLPASIGLAIAGASMIARIAVLAPWPDLRLLSAAGLFFLLVCGAGTIQRNVQAFEGPLPLDPAAPSQAASTPPALTESPGRLVSANQMLSRSLTLYQEGKFQESIAVAQAALQIDPNSADAYNNIAAAHASLRQWDEAITAAQQALRLQPDFTLARNNLNWALEQKRLGH